MIEPVTLTFRFPDSRSSRMPLVLEVAKQHEVSARELLHGKRTLIYYEVNVKLVDRKAVQSALSLTRHLFGMKSTEIFADGEVLHRHHVESVLVCLEKSFQVSDWRGHCWVVHRIAVPPTFPEKTIPSEQMIATLEALKTKPPDKIWLSPCRLADSFTMSRIHAGHPASIKAQVEGVIVQRGSRWCPRLKNMEEWELLQWGKVDKEA